MLALGIRYLNGWALATDPSSYLRAEWPPHPGRVYMALAAAHFETDGDKAERAALLWLEKQPPPALTVSDHERRSVVTAYVPVNDVELARVREGKVLKEPSAEQVRNGLRLLPENRSRQARQFPVAIPHDPIVYLTWPDTDPAAEDRRALAALCAKVTRVGHSASLVQMWVAENPAALEPSLVPAEGVSTAHRLRVAGAGRLTDLEARFAAELRPTPGLWMGYDTVRKQPLESSAQSVFDDQIIVLKRESGPPLGLENTLPLTEALRNAVLKRCPQQPPPEWISGHAADGAPSQNPHLAFFPLPFVEHEHADGHLLGVGIAVPRAVPEEERGRCLGDLLYEPDGDYREIGLKMGPIGTWTLRQADAGYQRATLCPETWTAAEKPARVWATVTPFVFGRFPKSDAERDALIAESCQMIGLPQPVGIRTDKVSCFRGVPIADPRHGFPRMPAKPGQPHRFQTHLAVEFETPVPGPVLLGWGRYRGYGLCRPLRVEGGEET